MGYDCGSFEDRVHGKLHLEASGYRVVFWTTPEISPTLSLEINEARKLQSALELALDYYYKDVE